MLNIFDPRVLEQRNVDALGNAQSETSCGCCQALAAGGEDAAAAAVDAICSCLSDRRLGMGGDQQVTN